MKVRTATSAMANGGGLGMIRQAHMPFPKKYEKTCITAE